MSDELKEGFSFGQVKKRAVKGVTALTGRTFILQLISFVGFFLLTVFLGTEQIGLFFAVSEIVAILGYFSDIGLAAALIQKKDKVDKKDIQSTFAIQQGIVIFLIGLVVILTPLLKRFYEIGPRGIWLLRSLLFGFFLASLKTIPSVLLERKLRFDLLVIVELVENLLFYGISSFLAWQGFGVISYAWAVLARGLAGAGLIYLLSPWPIGFSFHKKSLGELLKFGIPYQANSILAVVKDRLMNVFLWKFIGARGVGMLGWAQKWAQMPLRFIMDPAMKVTFPAFSRIQDDHEGLKRGVEFSLFAVAALAFPLLLGMSLLAGPLIEIIPRYRKWQDALLPLYLFCFNSLWSSISTPILNAFNALGKIKLTFKLMILWTVLTWIFTPFLAIRFGYQGAAWALGLIPVSSIIVFYLAKKNLDIDIIQAISPSFLASLAMGGCVWLMVKKLVVNNFFLLGLVVFIGGLVYSGCLFLLARDRLFKGFSLFKDAFS